MQLPGSWRFAKRATYSDIYYAGQHGELGPYTQTHWVLVLPRRGRANFTDDKNSYHPLFRTKVWTHAMCFLCLLVFTRCQRRRFDWEEMILFSRVEVCLCHDSSRMESLPCSHLCSNQFWSRSQKIWHKFGINHENSGRKWLFLI